CSSPERDRERPGRLLALLEEIQARHSYLPEPLLRQVAQATGASLVDVYGVATFYKAFSLRPRGQHLVSVCLGTACHVRGGGAILQEFTRRLGIGPGQTTPDREVTLETVNCLGACALGPVVVVDGHYFPNVSRAGVAGLIERATVGLDHVDVRTDERIFPLEVACFRCRRSLMDPRHYVDGYPSICVTASFGARHGWIRLSCLYGSYSVDYEHPVPADAVVHFFCPHCHAELAAPERCDRCDAPMVPLHVRGGGTVQICSRRGCKGHRLDLRESALET
ncbi:MAG: NAD(P)H-dependent oxidoreductase subunit E, partial [Candidatus Methylomirabilales bacterium]